MATKMLRVFVEAINEEIISWAPKPRFVFSQFWHALGTKGAQEVVLESEREKLEGKVGKIALEGEKAEIKWDRDGRAVCVSNANLIHQFKLEEYGHITYMKVSVDGEENDSFDTKLLEEQLQILWDLKVKKEDLKEEEDKDKVKELEKELDEVDKDIKTITTLFIRLGLKASCEDLRSVANSEQKRKKLRKELRQMKDELAEKVMREKKLQENQRKREEKKRRQEERKAWKEKKVPAAPEATAPAPEATASASTVPEASLPESTVPVEKQT